MNRSHPRHYFLAGLVALFVAQGCVGLPAASPAVVANISPLADASVEHAPVEHAPAILRDRERRLLAALEAVAPEARAVVLTGATPGDAILAALHGAGLEQVDASHAQAAFLTIAVKDFTRR